jgi:hypothetical protein
MFVLGGRVKGGLVYGQWLGLAPEQLNEGRDLQVTTDFRQVLAEAVYKQIGARDLNLTFPGSRLTPENLELFVSVQNQDNSRSHLARRYIIQSPTLPTVSRSGRPLSGASSRVVVQFK